MMPTSKPASKTEDRLSIRANANQKTTLRRAAEARHMNVSQFVLQASLSEAERILKEEAELVLSKEQFEWIVQLLDAPADPAPRLREAIRQNPVWNG